MCERRFTSSGFVASLFTIHIIIVVVEEIEKEDKNDALLCRVIQLGIQDSCLVRHTPPSALSSPLSLYYQFISQHDRSQYTEALSSYQALRQLYPWWREGIDRYSSVLCVQKHASALVSLGVEVERYEKDLKEVISSTACDA